MRSRVAYEERFAGTIAGWARDAGERERWMSRGDVVVDAELLRAWGEAPGVSPYVFLDGGEACAYAELWEDREADEAELAHVIVAPECRGRGLGRHVVASLVEEARARGFADVWMRVVAENAPALACYAGAGFVRASAELESEFNRGQPREYAWLKWTGP